MNDLEQQIKRKKQALDIMDPPADLWEAVQQEKRKPPRASRSTSWRAMYFVAGIAAGVLVLLGLFIGGGLGGSRTDLLEWKTQAPFAQYEAEVSIKLEQLRKVEVPAEQLADFELLLQQLKALDAEYAEFIEAIESDGYHPELGRSLIGHYASKIALLEKIQKSIEEINYYHDKYDTHVQKTPLRL